MRGLVNLVVVAVALATALLPGTLQSRTQDNSSVLTEMPASASQNVRSLPPPQQPSSRPAAKQLEARPVRRPFMRPVEPDANGAPVAEELIPAPVTTEVVVRPAPRIVTHASRSARRMFGRSGQVDLVMVAQNPADGCLYEIPLCVPPCCTGEPTVVERRGIFGRGVVEYCWPCGFTATVKFRHILGDVKIDYDT